MKPNVTSTISLDARQSSPATALDIRRQGHTASVLACCVLTLFVCCCGCAEGRKSGKDVGARSGGGLKPKMTNDIGEFKP